jgi:hypothetical protein
MTPARMAIFAGYFLGVTLACGLAFRRLRSQLHGQRPAKAGRKQRA